MKIAQTSISDIETYLNQHHTKQTAKTYLFCIGHFLRTNPEAERYGYTDIAHYMAEERKRRIQSGAKPSGSMNAQLSAIKRYYDFLNETGIRKDHPCKGFSIKGTRTKGINFSGLFTPEELESMVDARQERFENIVALRNKAMISLLVYQGPTSAELCSIRLSHIDFDAGTVYFPSASKTASRRIPLHPKQGMLLYRYIHECRPRLMRDADSDILFFGMRGEPETVEGLHSMLEPMKVLFQGKILSPKNIRMSVIANWINVRGYPIEEVQMLAGHRWPSSTVVYKRSDDDRAKEIIDAFHPLM